MRIVIDYQGGQSAGSRTRGIGRYTASITRSIISAANGDQIILLLNGAFSDTVPLIRAEFDDILPQENIIVWQPLRPVAHIQRDNDDRRRAAEALRESIIARLNPDILLITSHFEGSGDDGTTTVANLPSFYPTAIVLYDLIPYIYRSIYLQNVDVERWYEERIGNLKKADLLLCISESSRREAVDYLGYSEDRSVNVGTAADDHFKKVDLDDGAREIVFQRYSISKPFVMYTGGIDHRKNIEGLIRAYAALPRHVRSLHQLAVVCSLRPEDGPRLRRIAEDEGLRPDELVLPGFVPESDLIALYSTCKLFVFPSWHEGFGLPALEAMWCGAPVIASNRSSLPEVVGEHRAMFDPHNEKAITAKIQEALEDKELREHLIKNSSHRASLFSWDKIGRRALQSLRSTVARWQHENPISPPRVQRPRLAMVSPVPPARSGIAAYVAILIRSLVEYYEITVVVGGDCALDDPFIAANCRVISASLFEKTSWEYDRVVYQFGNSDHHNYMVSLIQNHPGVVVLHDFFVSDLSSWREHLGGVPGSWGYDITESHGVAALVVRHSEPDLFKVINTYPCSYAITRYALGVLCHSQCAKDLETFWHGSEAARDWRVVPMVRPPLNLPERSQSRRELGINNNEFVACAFGILGRSKLNHVLIEAWLSSSVSKNRNSRLVFVGGYGSQDYIDELNALIDGHGGKVKVEFSGWVSEDLYRKYLASADIAVQLRGSTHGETSAAVLDAMLAGIPVIANRSPTIPPEAEPFMSLVPADAPVRSIARTIEELYESKSLRAELAERSKIYATENHSGSVCGRKFAEALELSYRTSMVTLNSAVERISSLNISATDAEFLSDQLAAAVDQREALLLDVTSLAPSLARFYKSTVGPLLLGLGQRRPSLRVVPVERRGEHYVSALEMVRCAALYPPVHQIPEPVLARSIDRIVSLHCNDRAAAEGIAELVGARFLAIDTCESFDPSYVLPKILEFVACSGSLPPSSFASGYETGGAESVVSTAQSPACALGFTEPSCHEGG